MKILVACQYYKPEPFRISDICEELVNFGHDVTVITGVPNYPGGKTYDEYRKNQKKHEIINGVKVHRCFTIGRGSNSIMRFMNYFSYAFSSSAYAKKIKEEFDVVFVYQLSPVMMAMPAISYKKKNNIPAILYCLDLWPESLLSGGVKKESLVYRIFYHISKKIYKHFDRILITSKSFRKYFVENIGIDSRKIEYMPQYAENLFLNEDCKKVADEYVDLLFAGNVGVAQKIDTIIKAARETTDNDKIRWHIVGDGSELENCKKMCEKFSLNNVFFYGRKPVEEMPKYYRMADAMLVTLQNDDLISLTLPGKVQSYMAAGKPIIAAINGETAELIEKESLGYVCNAEDYISLAEIARQYEKNRSLHEVFANNSIKYYQNNFSMEIFFDKLQKELEDNMR